MTANRSTNFFARQQHARESCRNQMVLFVFAVLIIVLVTTLAIRFAWYLHISSHAYTSFNAATAQNYHQKLAAFTFFDPASFLFVAMAIVIVILTASVIKMNTLQKGGGAVAEMLGGRKIRAGTTEQAERRLINVVEEMAIASGIPVPQIYVLDSEHNINAFAAGLELTDAAVTVTKGALDKLTRDELQGVVAHEFSHILNGDMRLNVQLIGILYGILFLGIAGRKFLSGGRFSLRAGLPAMAAGLSLIIIGCIGSFLGRIMQCAITRQQELLADASAVQFTRNPLGLAGALKKIGGSAFGSSIHSAGARQASHLFFSESHPDELFPFLATHPPLVLRIRLLDPAFDGKFIPVKDERQTPKPQYTALSSLNIPVNSPLLSSVAADVIDQVGNPTPAHLGEGQTLLTSIPPDIRQSIKTPAGAACVIYALLMSADDSRRDLQTTALNRALVLQGSADRIPRICTQLSGLKQEQRLPLIALAMPALSGLTSTEKRNFLLILHSLINADGKVSLFELSVQWVLNKYLNPSEELFRSITLFSYSQVGLDIVVLLRALASAGHPGDQAQAENAFQAGLARIPELAVRKPVFSFENASYARVNDALTHLGNASFKIKESVIDACAHCAFADKTIALEESELLRVIALALQCPLPPFLEATPKPDAA
jgi:Zn-dependent protease with chaperone function